MLALSGCAQAQQRLATDLQDANANLSSAVKQGLLSPTDPGPPCLAAITAQLENPWVPKVSGPISGGSVGYVVLAQALGNAPIQIPQPCVTVIGQITIDGIRIGAGGLK